MQKQGMIGLIGGMSWESSAQYYRIINESIRTRLGGLHSARCVMWSVDFNEIATLQDEGRWEELAVILTGAAENLERVGADVIVLCTNTMHKVADDISDALTIPLLHIVDPTAEAITG